MGDLQTPPTEIEIAELVHALNGTGPLGGVLRRLAYQRDRLEAEVEQLERWASFCHCCAMSGEQPMSRKEFEAAEAKGEGDE